MKDIGTGNKLGASAPNINPLDFESEKCSKCGNEIFIPGVLFKKIPGILVGQGSETVEIPIKVFCCSKCGELSPYDKDTLDEHKNIKEKAESKKTNLII